jgi:hypothetical protein
VKKKQYASIAARIVILAGKVFIDNEHADSKQLTRVRDKEHHKKVESAA